MGTKNNPGEFDCYAKALPDEPTFILLGRDPNAPKYVQAWARDRELDIGRGARPESDRARVNEARQCANDMATWRTANDGAWRNSEITGNNMDPDRLLASAGKVLAALFETRKTLPPIERVLYRQLRDIHDLLERFVADKIRTSDAAYANANNVRTACEELYSIFETWRDLKGQRTFRENGPLGILKVD